ncbi:tripartite tricarboxylate transporter substrate-binding protein [Geminicoccaceae bacterium 1502E]|nr:tripartite tricarboxylate transporter substrate-binding protein [Geminicoccaceae bacterium 1502E]
MHRRLLALLPAALMAAAAIPAALAAWPEKQVTVFVPYPASTLAGRTARAFNDAIRGGELLPQPLLVKNSHRHFSRGAREALEAPADGYSFLVLDPAIMGAEAAGHLDFGFEDLTPVAETGRYCMLVVTARDSGIDSLGALVRRAKAEPGSLVWGANLRGYNHLAGLALAGEAEIDLPVAQTGGAEENVEALLSGRIAATAMTPAEYFRLAFLPSGAKDPAAPVQPIAYLGGERLLRLPDVPTAQETGHQLRFCVPVWWFAPKNTPAAAVEAMAGTLQQAGQSERLRKFWTGRDMDPTFLRGEALHESLARTWEMMEIPAIEALEARPGG